MKLWYKWILLGVLLLALVVGVSLLSRETPVQSSTPTPTHPPQTEPAQTEPPQTEPPQAQKAPDFTVLDSQGQQVRLSDYAGTPVVLNFWATWCQYCTKEMPDFNAMAEKYPDVQFMMVNATDGIQETVEAASAYIEDKGFTFDVFYDTEQSALTAYSITAFPTTFFINANGELVAYGSGMLSAQQLEEGIGMISQEEANGS